MAIELIVDPTAEVWDAFVAAHPQGHPLQTSAWAALKATVGWRARRLLLRDGGRPLAGGQLLLRHRYGVAAAYAPRGPLFSGDAGTDGALLAALERAARRARAVFLRVEPNLLDSQPELNIVRRLELEHGYAETAGVQPSTSVHLSLLPEPETLLAGMSKGHRADIRRAQRDGVAVRAGDGAADMASFQRIMETTAARAGFGIHSGGYYAAARRLFGERALLLLAEIDGAAVGGCLVVASCGVCLYLYGGSDERGLRSGANHLLQWQAIRWARERGCHTYDFWGVPDAFGALATATDEDERARLEERAKADPLYGVFRFKKGFGGAVVRYAPACDRVLIRPLYAIWRRTQPD